MRTKSLLVVVLLGLSFGMTVLQLRIEAVSDNRPPPICDDAKYCDDAEFDSPCTCPEWTDDREGAWCGTWNSIGQHGCWYE